jgi:hypothetical protein
MMESERFRRDFASYDLKHFLVAYQRLQAIALVAAGEQYADRIRRTLLRLTQGVQPAHTRKVLCRNDDMNWRCAER